MKIAARYLFAGPDGATELLDTPATATELLGERGEKRAHEESADLVFISASLATIMEHRPAAPKHKKYHYCFI